MKLIIDIDEETYKRICKVQDVSDLWDMYGEKVISSISSIRHGKPYEERPQGDLISREALKKTIKDSNIIHCFANLWYADILKEIDNATTVEYTFEEAFQKTVCEQKLYCPKRPLGEWIPVSEGLPRRNGVYIVTRIIDETRLIDACYFDGQNTWHSDNRVNHGRPYLNDVIAWQPRPEPYNKGGAV